MNPKRKLIGTLLALESDPIILLPHIDHKLPIFFMFLFHLFDIVDGEPRLLLNFQLFVQKHSNDVVLRSKLQMLLQTPLPKLPHDLATSFLRVPHEHPIKHFSLLGGLLLPVLLVLLIVLQAAFEELVRCSVMASAMVVIVILILIIFICELLARHNTLFPLLYFIFHVF